MRRPCDVRPWYFPVPKCEIGMVQVQYLGRAFSAMLLTVVACSSHQMARGVALPATDSAATWAPPPDPPYWPTVAWREATPESQGLNSSVLADALLDARERNVPIHSLLVVRRSIVVVDAAFYPFTSDTRHDLASITKSVTSLLAGAAVNAGRLSFTTPLLDAVPKALPFSDARRGRIRIEDLLAMQSGFDCGFGRNERELVAMKQSADWVAFALRMLMRSEPGTEFGYCSPNYHLLSAAIQHGAGMPEDDFARNVLFGPLGITDVYWPRDPQGVTRGWGDLQLRPRDLAKLGLLYLHGGRWDRQQIVSPDWVVRSTTPRVKYGERNLYAFGWWTNTGAPRGFFEAIGRGGQRLSIWPEKNLIVVMLGGGYEPGDIGSRLMRALVSDTALPADPNGVDRLRAAIARVAAAPAPLPVSRSPLEGSISGRVYSIETNNLGLERLSITFHEGQDPVARLELRDRTIIAPVGMDGRFRIAPQAIDSIHPGARGTWRTASQFVLELDLIGKVDNYTLAMTYEGDSVVLELGERTGLMHQTLRGRR